LWGEGGIEFDRAVRTGHRAMPPGLLARAHRGILYVDEVNLLDDHVVDVLLESAAMGGNTCRISWWMWLNCGSVSRLWVFGIRYSVVGAPTTDHRTPETECT